MRRASMDAILIRISDMSLVILQSFARIQFIYIFFVRFVFQGVDMIGICKEHKVLHSARRHSRIVSLNVMNTKLRSMALQIE